MKRLDKIISVHDVAYQTTIDWAADKQTHVSVYQCRTCQQHIIWRYNVQTWEQLMIALKLDAIDHPRPVVKTEAV